MIKSSRNSLLTKLGRRYQDISPVFRFIDYPFRALTNKRESNVPAVFLVAPPRSGSTLTYQLLTHSFENFHLTNIWNLLYSTPILGSILSEKFCYNKVTEFKS